MSAGSKEGAYVTVHGPPMDHGAGGAVVGARRAHGSSKRAVVIGLNSAGLGTLAGEGGPGAACTCMILAEAFGGIVAPSTVRICDRAKGGGARGTVGASLSAQKLSAARAARLQEWAGSHHAHLVRRADDDASVQALAQPSR